MALIWMGGGLIMAYLLGSLPTGYWLVKALKGLDIRQQGSGNIGATNVKRVLGPVWGNIVLLFDMLKGTIAVLLGQTVFFSAVGPLSMDVYKILCGIVAVCGHNWTVFLGFRGGKGVATSAGALLGLSPGMFLASVVVWILTAKISRYVSVASIAAVLVFCALTFICKASAEMKIFGVIMVIFLIAKHRANIRRLMQGTEPKIGQEKTTKADNALR